jgi:lipoprotein signal peptidase
VGPLLLLASALAIVACDQFSKTLVEGHGGAVLGRVGVGFRPRKNTRGAPVRLPVPAAVTVWLVVALAVALAMALAPEVRWTATLGLGLALGGAAGNLVDRVSRGGVVDFIVVGRWPAFNLADAALVVGAALCGWSLL